MRLAVRAAFSPDSARALLPLVSREKDRLEREEAGKGGPVSDREVTIGRLLLVCALFSGLEALEKGTEAARVMIEHDCSRFAWGAFADWCVHLSRVVNGRGLITIADSVALSLAGDALEFLGKDIAEKLSEWEAFS